MGSERTGQAVLTASEVAALRAARPEVRLLDVRTPGEYAAVHIEGAYNVPLDRLAEHGREIRSGVDAPVVLVCRTGGRARQAEEALRTAGMPDLHVMEGGMDGWVAAGLPVRRGAARLSLERQVRIAAGALAAAGGVLAVAVHPAFGLVSAFVGGGLVFAGVTDRCGMALLLARLPYNRPAAACDVGAMVRALRDGGAPAPSGSPAR